MQIKLQTIVEVAPYWNVNTHTARERKKLQRVEVAPYWNVNPLAVWLHAIPFAVEVAPYWNVNCNYTANMNINYEQKQLHIGM